jgi:hypothetical protein
VLTNNFSYYSREWEIPLLSKKNLRFWLRAFFDCEAWVENRPRQSRLIGLDCCHEEGLLQVQKALNRFDIKFNVKKRLDRDIWSLVLYGKENLKKFQKEIGFFHPKKKKKLEEAINSYVNYRWKIPLKKKELYRFVNFKGVKYGEGRIKFHSIVKASLLDLKKALNKYGIKSKLGGPWINNHGSVNYDLRIRIKEVKW